MFKFVVILALVAVAAASAPLSREAAARRNLPALQHEEVHDEFGQFALRYVTAEGTVVEQRGRLVPNKEGTDYDLIIEGSTTYIGDDGKTYVTRYTAGPDGSKVEGNHLPVAPEPIPAPQWGPKLELPLHAMIYIGNDGKTYVTRYTAGPDGSKVEGNHLPVAPEPIPAPQ
ncbi:insect cuticle protein domain-containing protein [Phthorimaea operculella]|nr:insect cuticle protein domain-containing protein [Phthorimaea operculella]